MEKKPYFISVCSPKGGVGKSTFTVLMAALLHYCMGRTVLVADCDPPQWSIYNQRQRELELMYRTDYFKLLMLRQWEKTHQKVWPVLQCQAADAIKTVEDFLSKDNRAFDYVLFDLPGTVATPGVLRLLSSIERLFMPMKADKIVMESTLTFARMVAGSLVPNTAVATRSVHLFWSMIDGRERTELYTQYEKIIDSFNLSVLDSRIPLRNRFSKELTPSGGPVYRSTLFIPDKSFITECRLGSLANEIAAITEGI